MKSELIKKGEHYEVRIPGSLDPKARLTGQCVKLGKKKNGTRALVTTWRTFVDPKFPGVGVVVSAEQVIRQVPKP